MFYNQSQSEGVIYDVIKHVHETMFDGADLHFESLTDEDIDEFLFLIFSGALDNDHRCAGLVQKLHDHFKFKTDELEVDNANTGHRRRKPYTSPYKNSECPVMGVTMYSRCSHHTCPFWNNEKPFNCRASERLTSRDISQIIDVPEAIVNREGDDGIRKVKQQFLEVFIQTEVEQEFVFLPVTEHCVLCAAELGSSDTHTVDNKPVCRQCVTQLGVAAELEVQYKIRASKILEEIAKRFSNARNVMDAIGISTSTVDRLYSRYGLNKRQLFTQNTSSGVRSTTARRPGRRIKLHTFMAKLTRIELDLSQDGQAIEPDTREIVADLYLDASRILELPVPPDLIEDVSSSNSTSR